MEHLYHLKDLSFAKEKKGKSPSSQRSGDYDRRDRSPPRGRDRGRGRLGNLSYRTGAWKGATWRIIPGKWLGNPHLEAMDFGHLAGEQSDFGDLR